jgi:hypothetical protein
MGDDPNFFAIAESFHVKSEVIETLALSIPFRDVFEMIVSAQSSDEFWNFVDSLPRRISTKLHAIQLKIPSTNKDFPSETMSPILQDFWAANAMNQGTTPTTVNSRAFSQVHPELIEEILIAKKIGSQVDPAHWSICGIVFSTSLLADLADCFVCSGRPWLFCEVDSLRMAYAAFANRLVALERESRHVSPHLSSKLLNFGYHSVIEMNADCPGPTDLPEFSVLKQLTDALSTLCHESRQVFSTTKPLEIGPISDWVASRSEWLIGQMSLPLQQRSAFVLTPNVLQARSGQTPDVTFEPFSVAELLFSNSNGEAAPMPFAGCVAELPSSSQLPFCRSAFRRFVARQLSVYGFKSASDPVLDILADIMDDEVKKIAHAAIAIRQGTNAPCRACLVHALEIFGYGNVMNEAK